MVICSLSCIVYVILLLNEHYSPHERALQRGGLIYFICAIGIFTTILLYKWYPVLFVFLSPLLYACHTGASAVFYFIVFKMTAGNREARFPRIHILLPLVIPFVLAVWIPLVPFNVPLGIVKGFRELNPEWPIFSNIFASFLLAEVIFGIGYLSLSFIRLYHYHRLLPQSKRKNTRYQLRWIYAIGILICIIWIYYFLTMVISLRTLYSTLWIIISAVFIMIVVEIILLFNLQRHNYPPLDIKSSSKQNIQLGELSIQLPIQKETIASAPEKIILKQLSRKDFESYFRREKPYLDSGLKLTALAEELGLRRDELSRFINTAYGVNFNVLIGQWRLRELEKLRKLSKNKDVSIKTLLPQVGFAYYNSYMRARKEIEGKKVNDKNSNSQYEAGI